MLKKIDKIAEARRLRFEEKMAITQIASFLGVAKSSVSAWVRDLPLTPEEKEASRIATTRKNIASKSKPLGSKLNSIKLEGYSTDQKGNIAEAVVLARLIVRDFEVYSPVFGGSSLDFVCKHALSNKLLRVQVRWASIKKYGRPTIKLTKSDGRRGSKKYTVDEFDFIIGYYLFEDCCFVFSNEDVKNNLFVITCSENARERWDKLS